MAVRIDRSDCPTVQANDARDLTRSGRVALAREAAPAGAVVFTVAVDGTPVGVVVKRDAGWVAARRGWRDAPRPKRHAAVRRLLMSHPAGTFAQRATTGRDTR